MHCVAARATHCCVGQCQKIMLPNSNQAGCRAILYHRELPVHLQVPGTLGWLEESHCTAL
eukprot:2411302-Amphidinium_carterae.1